jgi:hypothetical protein
MPAVNPFLNTGMSPVFPAVSLVAITPSDSSDLTTMVRQIYAGVAGDVCVIDSAGNTVTFVGVQAGSTIGPFAVSRVKATGTTATNLVGYV